MNPITAAVIRAGLISPAMLIEMKRISPVIDKEVSAGDPVDLETAAQIVEEALQSEEYVLIRMTDFELIRQYTENSKQGVLHLAFDAEQQADIEVTYCRTKLGEIVFAWRGDSIRDALINGLTYFREDAEDVYFTDVREFFYGEQKAFMVCIPAEAR